MCSLLDLASPLGIDRTGLGSPAKPTLQVEPPLSMTMRVVAFAPAEDPQIALAALVVNDPKWKIKSTFLGREILEEFFIAKQAEK